jgi:transposase
MRGKKISTDLKYTILALGYFHSISEIEALTGVSRRQIYRIRNIWEMTGCVEPKSVGKRGRPRFLTRDEEVVRSLHSSPGSIAETKN